MVSGSFVVCFLFVCFFMVVTRFFFSIKLSIGNGTGKKIDKLKRSSKTKEDKSDDLGSRHSSGRFSGKFSSGEPDPGVISEGDDEFRVQLLKTM